MNPTKRWPELPYDGWKETYATFHMWMQIVGKVALAQSPLLNHSWGIAMQVTPRGIATRTLPQGQRTFSSHYWKKIASIAKSERPLWVESGRSVQ